VRGERSHRAVLVAEDNAISRDVLTQQLALLDCQVVVCEDGGRAAEAWRGGGFDLLLTDLQMPGLDGFALAALIRAEEGEGRMPIVALTAGSSMAEVERCHAAGIDECLAKPASLSALRGALQRWLAPDA
jgi:CheY-like chemotaxis protein